MLVGFLQGRRLSRRIIYRLGRGRARKIVHRITPHLRGSTRIVDIGAGTCNVCELLREKGYDVTPVDVEDLSFVDGLKAQLVDGERLPFDDNVFDVALVLTVLHHTPEPEKVLAEAARVADGIVILEDIYAGRLQKRLTFFFDSLLNLEFAGHPHTNKSDDEWRALFEGMKLQLRDTRYDSFLALRSVTYFLEA